MADTRDYSKDLSTTALAKAINKPLQALFQQLVDMGLIVKNGDNWDLTPNGKAKGGLYKDGGKKIGRYIVWPEIFEQEFNAPMVKPSQPPTNQNVGKEYPINAKRITPIVSEPRQPIKEPAKENSHLLTATSIGKEFDMPPTRINSIFSELGWITRDNIKGWLITELGKRLGGVQSRDHVSGIPYVRWPESIIKNKLLIDSVSEARGEVSKVEEPKNQTPATDTTEFRDKFRPEHRAQDGHYVRSKSEIIIDNWLYVSKTVHAYERKLPIEEDVYCDFYIPTGKVYIEYWGSEDEKYLARKAKKLEIYKKYGFKLIQLTDKDVFNLDDVLPRKLLEFDVPIE